MNDYQKELMDNIIKASNVISSKSRRTGADWLIMGASQAMVMSKLMKNRNTNRISKIKKIYEII